MRKGPKHPQNTAAAAFLDTIYRFGACFQIAFGTIRFLRHFMEIMLTFFAMRALTAAGKICKI